MEIDNDCSCCASSADEGKDDERVEVDAKRGGRSASTPSLDEMIEKRRLKSHNSASGMSQTDLRATIRMVQLDPTLSSAEKTKKIQEIMSFSWRQTQAKAQANSSKSKRRTNSARNLRRMQSTGALNGEQRLAPQRSQSGVFISANDDGSSGSGSNQDGLAGLEAERVDDEDTDVEDSVEDPIEVFQDEANGVHGCKHYQRRCMVSAPCCDEFYTCRFCHDECEDHEIVRKEINRTRCMKCGHVQGIRETCEKCETRFARYFCGECRFFDDKEGKHIYHCDKCNICRIGEGLGVDYFHCDRCNACMSITLKDHKCVERSLESDCPVCSEFLFTSTTPVMFLPCGHCIHVKCYESYTATNYTCPICGKSLGDMQAYFQRIDEMLATERMPEEYQGVRSRIFCADCEVRSIVPFHFVYHKCTKCSSYNTKVLEQLPREEPAVAAPEERGPLAVARALVEARRARVARNNRPASTATPTPTQASSLPSPPRAPAEEHRGVEHELGPAGIRSGVEASRSREDNAREQRTQTPQRPRWR